MGAVINDFKFPAYSSPKKHNDDVSFTVYKDGIPLLADDGKNYDAWQVRMKAILKTTKVETEETPFRNVWGNMWSDYTNADPFVSKSTVLLHLALSDELLSFVGLHKSGPEIWMTLLILFSKDRKNVKEHIESDDCKSMVKWYNRHSEIFNPTITSL